MVINWVRGMRVGGKQSSESDERELAEEKHWESKYSTREVLSDVVTEITLIMHENGCFRVRREYRR